MAQDQIGQIAQMIAERLKGQQALQIHGQKIEDFFLLNLM
jgi:hypothetical protein